jgi:single-stranded DNA-binding protein
MANFSMVQGELRDCFFSQFNDGTGRLVNFTVKETYRLKTGEQKHRYVGCVAFNEKADQLKRNYEKGDPILVTGASSRSNTKRKDKNDKDIWEQSITVNSLDRDDESNQEQSPVQSNTQEMPSF